jgi:hypothetical protein
MTNITTQPGGEIIQSLVLQGDLSKMTEAQKVEYYQRFCQSLGLNPLTQPFQIISFQGKQRLYATKDCTEQLRKLHGVSIIDLQSQNLGGVYVVTAKAQDKNGKTDASTGAVTIENLRGEALANALMKAETKAKRRVTLSICGMGMLDESELDTMPQHTTAPVPTNVTVDVAEKKKAAPKAELTAEDAARIVELSSEYGWYCEQLASVLNPATVAKIKPSDTWTVETYEKGIAWCKDEAVKRKIELV